MTSISAFSGLEQGPSDHVARETGDSASTAKAFRFDLLAYLLQLAPVEAERQSEGRGPDLIHADGTDSRGRWSAEDMPIGSPHEHLRRRFASNQVLHGVDILTALSADTDALMRGGIENLAVIEASGDRIDRLSADNRRLLDQLCTVG